MEGNKTKLTVEGMYQDFITRMGLHEDKMHPMQRAQLRQAFFGGVGSLMVFLTDEVSTVPEEEGEVLMNALLRQVNEYWLSQANQLN